MILKKEQESHGDKPNKKILVIIDGNSVVHRSFHALPQLTNKKGELVNAVYGFFLVFFKAVRELEPDYLAATFDSPAPTFRHTKFKEYKAKRKKAPQELYDQIPKIKDLLKYFDVSIFEKQGFEADDLIATIAEKAKKQQAFPEIETYIITSDSDAFQLVDKNTKVYNLNRGIRNIEIYDKEKVMEHLDILPNQVVDFKGLAGDASDNIPGATGIGKKKTIDLLKNYQSIENLYNVLEKGEAWDMNSKTKELLLQYKDQVFFSYDLAKAEKNVPIDFFLEKSKWQAPSANKERKEKLQKVFRDYNFFSLLDKIP